MIIGRRRTCIYYLYGKTLHARRAHDNTERAKSPRPFLKFNLQLRVVHVFKFLVSIRDILEI